MPAAPIKKVSSGSMIIFLNNFRIKHEYTVYLNEKGRLSDKKYFSKGVFTRRLLVLHSSTVKQEM